MKNIRLLSAAFISGACVMIVEIAGSRVLAPYLGSTIFTWAALITTVLACLSLGYYFGGIIADRSGKAAHFSFILAAASISTLMIPFAARALLPLTYSLDLRLASLLASLLLAPASLFYGMVSPFAIRLTARKGRQGSSSGDVYALSTTGSILGTLAAGFILVQFLGLTAVFALTAFFMLFASLVSFHEKAR